MEHLRNKHRVCVIRYKKYVPPPPSPTPRPIFLPRRQIDGQRNMLILPKSSVGQNQSGVSLLNLPKNAKAVVIPKNARVVRDESGRMKLLVPSSPQKLASFTSSCHRCQFKGTTRIVNGRVIRFGFEL